MNYKRKKSRKNVRCNICTDARIGNSKKAEGRSARVGMRASTKSERKRQSQKDLYD